MDVIAPLIPKPPCRETAGAALGEAPRIGRYRKMNKNHEYLTKTSEAFIYTAMARLMLRRLARTAAKTG